MVLSCMNLSDSPANAWPVVPDHNEQIFGNEPNFIIDLHDLYVCETLTIGTNFVLAFDDKYAPIPQDTPSFTATITIQVQYGFVVFATSPVS